MAVAAALDRCSSAISGREEEIEMAEATLLEMESRESSITLPCLGMLKAIEWVASNGSRSSWCCGGCRCSAVQCATASPVVDSYFTWLVLVRSALMPIGREGTVFLVPRTLYPLSLTPYSPDVHKAIIRNHIFQLSIARNRHRFCNSPLSQEQPS